MKKSFSIFLMFFTFLGLKAQQKEQKIDTVKTEVVNVVTKYNPKIADAKKIKKNPTISLLEKNEKKKLKYTIQSAPVASTFIPKSGAVKGIKIGSKEFIYDNYVAAGYGNYGTPYFEAFLGKIDRYNNEFQLSTKYLSSTNNLKDIVLNSNYTNFDINASYKKIDHYFDWKVILNSERDVYNWYGLPDITYTETTINNIDEEQIYNYFNAKGEFTFNDSYIDYIHLNTSYFADTYKSAEVLIKLNSKLDLPVYLFNRDFNDIALYSSLELLNGKFKNSYNVDDEIKYSIFTINLNPNYNMEYLGITFNAGVNVAASFDSENSSNNFYVLPELIIQSPIVEEYLNIYGGFTSNLHTNTYKQFTEENPYISPTQSISQTLETSNLFVGFNGKISRDFNFNIKLSSKKEENKPLFLRNYSKSNGTTNTYNGINLNGYEYGNSFSVYYDDVKTTTLFTELEYEYSDYLTLGVQGIYNNYKLENATENWNLPTVEASFSAKYKEDKWFASTNIFYVSERKDALYSGLFTGEINDVETVDAFVDVNLNGGYHFNDQFSAFLKLNNVLNTNYQRFANFNTQGFQILGGVTYKFDF
ncbi:hypothetical protein [Polaribacter sargassicola]|uniref:hypothetical protein n=1 Tax=Polaribacter sargassicola TaxID=2836891 RepID=UPI001F2AD37E|nr:hypothetical protein [Polaribacter sp. DS7-9]MCG1035829.1 hypothetical protein [Polaribacter sp. DS7-9]